MNEQAQIEQLRAEVNANSELLRQLIKSQTQSMEISKIARECDEELLRKILSLKRSQQALYAMVRAICHSIPELNEAWLAFEAEVQREPVQ